MNYCEVCGKETKNKRFCSVECKAKSMSKPKGKCLYCEKELDRCEVKYCSKECYQKHKKQKYEKSLVYNKCIICGKPTLNEKYCSQKCMGKDENRKITAINNLNNEHNWTEEEIEYLKNNYGVLNINDIAKHLNIKKENIVAYASKHNIISHCKWTKEDLEYLLKNNDLDLNVLCTYFNKSKSAITNKYRILNGFSDKNGKSIISPQEYIYNYIKNDLKLYCIQEVPIKNFKTDIFIPEFFLDIEVQGGIWHLDPRFFDMDSLNKNQLSIIEKDKRKKQLLKELSINTIYIWEYDIISNPQKCKQEILQKINQLKSSNIEIKKLNTYTEQLNNSKQYLIDYIENELCLPYIKDIKLWNYNVDILVSSALCINIKECWIYGDTRFGSKLTSIQKEQINKDKKRIMSLTNKKMDILSLWEYDIISNPQSVKEQVNKILKEKNILKGLPN